jgi:hypothetical protein
MLQGPFTKDVRAEAGLENQDKLGHRGGRGFLAIRMYEILKNSKNLFFLYFELSFPL